MVSEAQDKQIINFSEALNVALDEIGFPAAPERNTRLMELLGLSQIQVYRILAGKAFPTVPSLIKLKSIGISLDEIFDHVDGVAYAGLAKIVWGKLKINEVEVTCQLTISTLNTRNSGIFATRSKDSSWEIKDKKFLGAHETAYEIKTIRFVNTRQKIAVVDDEEGTLKIICDQLASSFETIPFQAGQNLLSYSQELLQSFSCFVIDWKLQDIDGEKLVSTLLEKTNVPIIIITGMKSASPKLANIIQKSNVHYVAKPTEESIFIAVVKKALTQEK